MNQRELNDAVARATGESVTTVKRLGFLLAEFDLTEPMPGGAHSQVEIIDWDELAQIRNAEAQGAHDRELVAF
jgi:hypothetical protein